MSALRIVLVGFLCLAVVLLVAGNEEESNDVVSAGEHILHKREADPGRRRMKGRKKKKSGRNAKKRKNNQKRRKGKKSGRKNRRKKTKAANKNVKKVISKNVFSRQSAECVTNLADYARIAAKKASTIIKQVNNN